MNRLFLVRMNDMSCIYKQIWFTGVHFASISVTLLFNNKIDCLVWKFYFNELLLKMWQSREKFFQILYFSRYSSNIEAISDLFSVKINIVRTYLTFTWTWTYLTYSTAWTIQQNSIKTYLWRYEVICLNIF